MQTIEHQLAAVGRYVETADQWPRAEGRQRPIDTAAQIHQPELLVRQIAAQQYQLIVTDEIESSRSAAQMQGRQDMGAAVGVDAENLKVGSGVGSREHVEAATRRPCRFEGVGFAQHHGVTSVHGNLQQPWRRTVHGGDSEPLPLG